MDPKNVDRVIRQITMFGYRHVSPEIEDAWLGLLLSGEIDLETFLTPDSMGRYRLAAEPLRSLKNGVICLVTVVCREVIHRGAHAENCYALSDYYINEVEECAAPEEVSRLAIQLIRHYSQLARDTQQHAYSPPISRAIHYISNHLYEPCRLTDIAREVKLNPSYLSALFKKDVGTNIKQYIQRKKLEEARTLLASADFSIAEIASMLGYSSSSHFAREFNKRYRCSPREFLISKAYEAAVNPNLQTVP